MPETHRRLAARLQEAYAGFLEHTDAQIGRLVDALERLGQLDDTLLVVLSDNGASQEGGPFGVLHEMKFFNFILETPDEAVERIDDIGGPRSHTNYPWGWAQAGNTPLQVVQAEHARGRRPRPARRALAGRRRTVRARHDARPVPPRERPRPDDLRRRRASPRRPPTGASPQLPITGTSMRVLARRPRGAHAQDRPVLRDDGAPRARTSTAGRPSRATRPASPSTTTPGSSTTWPRTAPSATTSPKPSPSGSRRWSRGGGRRPRPTACCPSTTARSSCSPHGSPTAPCTARRATTPTGRPSRRCPHRRARRSAGAAGTSRRPSSASSGDDGVLFAVGNENSGMSLFVLEGRLVFDYNFFGEHHVATSTRPVPVGSERRRRALPPRRAPAATRRS